MGKYYAVSSTGGYLEHHGIKGQKWGERRFQNEDGSLTEAGRARYNVQDAKRAALDGGLLGYAKYRATHSGRSEAIAEYKKQKRIDKATKYRDRLANRASIKAKNNRELAKSDRAALNDLKKNGRNSETYQKYVRDKVESDYDHNMWKASYEKDPEEAADAKAMAEWEALGSTFLMNTSFGSAKHIENLTKEYKESSKRYTNEAKRWEQNNANLMNMKISDLTSKREIRKIYRATN